MTRPFVTVVTVSSALALVEGHAAANPPAPSSVPDPASLVPNPSNTTPHRLRRHDGGCFAYTDDGPVAKAACTKELEHPGEEIDREHSSGVCILFDPWEDEPRSVVCPTLLVPSGFRPASAATAPVAALAPPEPRGSCARCSIGLDSQDETRPLTGAVAVLVLATVRRRGNYSRRARVVR